MKRFPISTFKGIKTQDGIPYGVLGHGDKERNYVLVSDTGESCVRTVRKVDKWPDAVPKVAALLISKINAAGGIIYNAQTEKFAPQDINDPVELKTTNNGEEVDMTKEINPDLKEEVKVDEAKTEEVVTEAKPEEVKAKAKPVRKSLFDLPALRKHFMDASYEGYKLLEGNDIDAEVAIAVKDVVVDFGLGSIADKDIARALTNARLSYNENKVKIPKGEYKAFVDSLVTEEKNKKLAITILMHGYKYLAVKAKSNELKAAAKAAKKAEKEEAKDQKVIDDSMK